jgi:hypothetical protein
MKTKLTQVDKIRVLLGQEVPKSQMQVTTAVNLATETLNEGEATIEAEVFEAGQPVMIVNEDERIPLPIGEYLLDNGMVLVVEEEGIIASIGEKSEEEEQPEEEEVAASEKAKSPLPKTIIESIVKETKFSKEDMDAKDTEITELKAKITELEKVESTDEDIKLAKEKEEAEAVELSKKGAKHNPEEKANHVFKLKAQGKQTIGQSVMSKMANRK